MLTILVSEGESVDQGTGPVGNRNRQGHGTAVPSPVRRGPSSRFWFPKATRSTSVPRSSRSKRANPRPQPPKKSRKSEAPEARAQARTGTRARAGTPEGRSASARARCSGCSGCSRNTAASSGTTPAGRQARRWRRLGSSWPQRSPVGSRVGCRPAPRAPQRGWRPRDRRRCAHPRASCPRAGRLERVARRHPARHARLRWPGCGAGRKDEPHAKDHRGQHGSQLHHDSTAHQLRRRRRHRAGRDACPVEGRLRQARA